MMHGILKFSKDRTARCIVGHSCLETQGSAIPRAKTLASAAESNYLDDGSLPAESRGPKLHIGRWVALAEASVTVLAIVDVCNDGRHCGRVTAQPECDSCALFFFFLDHRYDRRYGVGVLVWVLRAGR